MLSGVTNFFVGDLDSEKLKAEIKNSQCAVIEKDFGLLGGKVYFVKHTENINVPELLDGLDTEEHGRGFGRTVAFFAGDKFLVKRTDKNAINHHRIYMQCLSRPQDYIQFILTAVKRYLASGSEFTLMDLGVNPIRNALAMGMFETNGLSPEFTKAISAFTQILQDVDDFSKQILFSLIGTHYTYLFQALPQYRAARESYLKMAEGFIGAQGDRIFAELKRYAKNERITNILTLTVIELIRERFPQYVEQREELNAYLEAMDRDTCNEYLTSSYLRSVPASIVAGDNTMRVITCGLTALATNKELLTELRKEIDSLHLLDGEKPEQIQKAIDENRHKGGLLHRFFLESARRETMLKDAESLSYEQMLIRYTNSGLTIDGKDIPPGSYLLINMAMPRFDEKIWDHPDAFNPDRFLNATKDGLNNTLAKIPMMFFSEGHRMCPAHILTEYICKTYVAYIAANYDLVLESEKDLQHLDKIKRFDRVNVRLVPRESGQKLSVNFI